MYATESGADAIAEEEKLYAVGLAVCAVRPPPCGTRLALLAPHHRVDGLASLALLAPEAGADSIAEQEQFPTPQPLARSEEKL